MVSLPLKHSPNYPDYSRPQPEGHTDTQKEIAYTSETGKSAPITEKIVMPTIEGAVITAEGAGNANVKASIVSAVEAVTGLAVHKIQVFEMGSK